MKFSTRTDIEAPAEAVFDHLSDFPRYERQLRRRGVDLRRLDRGEGRAPGMCWLAKLEFRGKPLKIQAELTELRGPELISFGSRARGLQATFEAELIALSRKRTRMRIALEIRPHTLPARLLVQSLKFSKSNLDKQFGERVDLFARSIETAWNPDLGLGPK